MIDERNAWTMCVGDAATADGNAPVTAATVVATDVVDGAAATAAGAAVVLASPFTVTATGAVDVAAAALAALSADD